VCRERLFNHDNRQRERTPIPNTLAYVALYAWPAVCVLLFVMLPVEKAAIWSLLAGYLLLPSATSIDVALLPPLDKYSIPALSTFLLCAMRGTQAPRPRRSLLIYVCALAFVVSPLFTSLNNSYELHIGDKSLPGFYPMDGVKLALQNLITLAPFFIGLRYLGSDDGRAVLLKAIVAAGLVYSLPMLFEVRMSPQLHSWVYGFFPGGFGQHYRAGGFRPVVFLSQGLEAALFAALACIAALIAVRARWQILRVPASAASAYLGVVVIMCKTLGAALYAGLVAPLVLFTTPRTWVRVSCVIALMLAMYPMLRNYDLVPVRRVSAVASSISADRAGSFAVRVANEDVLLAKANQKPFFGWGTWGRNRLFDQDSGKSVTITDGAWIIRYGMFGWLGYLSLFGLFVISIFSARQGVRGPVTTASIVLGGLTLLLGINLLDLIPNANLLPFTYLVAGSIAGQARARERAQRRQGVAAARARETTLAVPS